MKSDEKTMNMIGFRPTMIESMKLSYIGATFDLNRCEVLRELMTGHWTLDELHAIAHKTESNNNVSQLPYFKRVYTTNKTIDEIVIDGKRLFDRDILGIHGLEDWEFIRDEK